MSSTKLLHLQGLRGVAIISVILFHFFPSQFPNGYIGVDIFFLLSGYLMTMMMARYETINYREIFDFLYKRLKRIAPLYFFSIFITLLVLQLAPDTLISANIDPAINAIIFITNLVRPNDLIGYFEKLGSAVDLFTHTWSLSLEVQYYLFFPMIFILFRLFSQKNGNILLIFGSFLSFLFYILADDFTSFNSMFARIWQFNAGTLSYIYSNPSKLEGLDNKKEEEDLESEKLINNEDLIPVENKQSAVVKASNKLEIPGDFNNVNMCLLALFALLLFDKFIESDFSRIYSIFLTMAIVQQGQGLFLIENKFIVFIGEISYGWYLFHWPIAAYCKLEHYQLPGLLGALGASLVISVVVHFLFEKQYLNWGKLVISVLVAVLLAANLALLSETRRSLSVNENEKEELKHLNLSTTVWENSFLYPSDFIENITLGYENKSADERIELNTWYSSTDLDRLKSFCKKPVKRHISLEGCQLNEEANITAKERLLVIGNSWASNAMLAIRDECQHKFSYLELAWAGTCEPLIPSWAGGKNEESCKDDEKMYVGLVKEFQPDVLFIVSRSFNMFIISNGSTPFNDFYFKTASRRLTEIQKHVKKQIFILDAFPEFNSIPFTGTLNDHLAKNRTFTSQEHGIIESPYAIAKMRYSRLVAECQKCILFDYTPQFFFNGKFYLYDPKYLISYMTTSGHLTPPAIERVRPIFRRICNLL